MLRITESTNGKHRTLRLEGKLLEPWTAELRAVVGPLDAPHGVTLDLGQVSFIDERGAELIRTLTQAGVRVVGCSRFLADILRLEAC